WGKADVVFMIPAAGPARIRAGLLGWNPPPTFYVEPHRGRAWIRQQGSLGRGAQAAVRSLIDRGFEPAHLRAHLGLSDEILLSPTLEEDVVRWAHDRFRDIVESRLLEHDLAGGGIDDDAEDGDG